MFSVVSPVLPVIFHFSLSVYWIRSELMLMDSRWLWVDHSPRAFQIFRLQIFRYLNSSVSFSHLSSPEIIEPNYTNIVEVEWQDSHYFQIKWRRNPLALAPLIKAIKVGFQKRKLMWRQIYKQPSEILLGLNSKKLFVWCYCPKHDKLLVENKFQLYMCNWFSFIFKWHHYYMAWVRAQLCKLQKRVHLTRSHKW
jgi:hypothetical protein